MSELVDGYAPLRIKRVVRETADAVSLVLDVPDHCSATFAYRAGQFLTLRVDLDGREFYRCYSMSSAPVEDELRITVKRDPGGLVSNWLNDIATEGVELHVAPPEGRFVLRESADELIAFAGGSGITPIISLVRTALVSTSRRVRLFYANRGRDSVIFADVLKELAARHPERFEVSFHYDDACGVVTSAAVIDFVGGGDADFYICGPTPFMDTVETAVGATGAPMERVHLERFVMAPVDLGEAIDDVAGVDEVVFRLDRKTIRASYRAGDTLLQTARSAGLKAPASCETGSCGTCMAKIVEGTARMLNNDALDDDEVAEGWVLTCQSLPTSTTVRVDYE